MGNQILKEIKKAVCFVLVLTTLLTGVPVTTQLVEAASTTNKVPIICYTMGTNKVTTYTTSSLAQSTGYIVSSDLCTIQELYSNGAVKVKYPISRGYRTAYASSGAFFSNVDFSTDTRTLGSKLTAYRRSTGTATIGSVYASDSVIITGSANNRTQIIYPTSSGYKCGWVDGNYVSSGNQSSGGQSSLSSSDAKALTFNAVFYADSYSDLKSAFGYNEAALYNHYIQYGIREGRSASPVFDPMYYLNHNSDLVAAYGNKNYSAAYTHFITYGYKEYRESSSFYNGTYYRNKYSDLASMPSHNLIMHYLNYGIREQRWGNSSGKIPNLEQKSGTTVLNVPSYKQYDSRWAGTYIGTKTIKQIGCLLTSLSMKYSYSSGTTIYPNAMKSRLSFSNNDLYWSSVSQLGYAYTGNYGCSITNSIMDTIYTQIKANKPVIIGGKKSSGSTHWVVITGYTGSSSSRFSSSDFTINDPNSSTRTTLNQFLSSYPTVLRLVY